MTGQTRQDIPRYVVGAVAASLAMYFLSSHTKPMEPVIFLASFFLLLICVTDTIKSRIPNSISLTLTICGFSYHFLNAGTTGLLTAFLGLLAGFCLLVIPYSMGGMGAGDVKALAALGTLLGPAIIFQVFLYTTLAGGIIAIFHYVLVGSFSEKITCWKASFLLYLSSRKLRHLLPADLHETQKFPYATAIAFGYFAYLSWGGIV